MSLVIGIISIFVSIFAVVILYLTRANILDILDKDVILFDRNFELKKNVIDSALKMIDDIQEKGKEITLRPEVQQLAKKIYNDLLCVSSDVVVADEFYNLAIEPSTEITETRLAQFKLMCRKDIGLNTKKARAVKRILEKQSTMSENETILRTNAMTNSQSMPSNSFNAMQQSKVATPTQPAIAQQPRPQVAVQQPVQPKPQATPAKPVAEPIKRVGRPKKS